MELPQLAPVLPIGLRRLRRDGYATLTSKQSTSVDY